MNTKENPADYVSREISMDNRDKVERWILFGNQKIPGTLTPRQETAGKCRITQLDQFIDESNVIRVGGRLQNSYISDDCKHPILLPRKGKV